MPLKLFRIIDFLRLNMNLYLYMQAVYMYICNLRIIFYNPGMSLNRSLLNLKISVKQKFNN